MIITCFLLENNSVLLLVG